MEAPTFNGKKDFGSSVRNWRCKLKISQEELASRAGLHRTYICDVERGARNVTLRSMEKLAQALQIPVSTLLSYDHDPQTRSFGEEMIDILYVEDNPQDANLACTGLRHVTNRIHIVNDGVAALNFLFGTTDATAQKPVFKPHLILLDLGLPKVDGLEVLRRLKMDVRTKDIPVVVLTSSARDRDLQMSKQLGATAYIIKPVDLQNLSEITPLLNMQWALLKPSAGMTRRPEVAQV